MNRKAINATIARKMRKWWESIDDEVLRKAVKRDTIVTGGAIASMLLGEKVNDFDVYLRTPGTAHALAMYYVARFNANRTAGDRESVPISVERKDEGTSEERVRIVVKSAGITSEDTNEGEDYAYFEQREPEEAQGYVAEVMSDVEAIVDVLDDPPAADIEEKPPFRPTFLSTNAITLANKVQVIIRFTGDPNEIHANYDFVHCTNYWTPDEKLVLRADAMESLLSRHLRYVGSRYPVCSMIRTRKFIKRGWHINAGQYVKMAMQVSALDLTSIAVLEDQLTGVDVAYFHQVIEFLKEKDPEKVEYAYLIEIIDRMF